MKEVSYACEERFIVHLLRKVKLTAKFQVGERKSGRVEGERDV